MGAKLISTDERGHQDRLARYLFYSPEFPVVCPPRRAGTLKPARHWSEQTTRFNSYQASESSLEWEHATSGHTTGSSGETGIEHVDTGDLASKR